MVETCSICGAEWDNRSQSHKRGTDCIDKLGSDVQQIITNLDRMKAALETVTKRVDAQAGVAKSHLDQIEKIMIQLNLLEKKLLAAKK